MTELAQKARLLYGAIELKEVKQKYMIYGLIIASVILFIGLGIYYATTLLGKEEAPVRTVRILKYSELGPPPSIQGASAAVAPSVSAAAPMAKPSVGIPVPVPDADVSPEQSFASQTEMSAVTGPVGEGAGAGSGAVIEQDVQVENIDEEEAPPPDFVPFEKEPQVIRRIEPVYPELARKAGLEGTVWVKLWVDKEGKVKDVVILKSASEIFNQPAIDAAKQWIFTPAMMKTGPVSVWISLSFNFKLN
ncbi:MAG TPA: energy transducer TonB [bacterium]|nr:energy transducer TonB [bacterium]